MTDEPKAAERIEPKAICIARKLKTMARNLLISWDAFEMQDICTESAAELLRLHAENEALRKDAERYRWIVTKAYFANQPHAPSINWFAPGR